MKKKEPSYAAGGTENWYCHCGKQYGGYSKKTKIDLSYDPAILLIGIHPKALYIQKYISTLMFIAALFMMARIWK